MKPGGGAPLVRNIGDNVIAGKNGDTSGIVNTRTSPVEFDGSDETLSKALWTQSDRMTTCGISIWSVQELVSVTFITLSYLKQTNDQMARENRDR